MKGGVGGGGLLLAVLLCLAFTLPACAAPSQPLPAATNLLTNPGFEAADAGGVPSGWEALWTRDPNMGTAVLDEKNTHGGQRSLQVVHHGTKDWAVAQAQPVAVSPGDIVTLSGWIKCDGAQDAQLSVVARGADGVTLNWMLGLIATGGTHDWQKLTRRLVIPASVATITYRLTGDGPGTVWLDDASLVKDGSAKALGDKLRGKTLRLTNRVLDVRLAAAEGTLAVTDRRIGRVWQQQPLTAGMIVKDADMQDARTARLTLWDALNDLTLTATLTLDPALPELTVRLEGAGPVPEAVAYPQPFVTAAGTALVVPMNEGILFPVDDATVYPMTLNTYSGHGLCMPWFGVTDTHSGAGVMAILGTPDDAHVEFTRSTGTGLYAQPAWEASRGAFTYPRVLTYVFSSAGGYVAQAKRYRAYAQKMGLFKTLAEKRRENPNIDRLIGAVNVWNWDEDKVAFCKELKALGMDHVLWSSGGSPTEVAAINALGFLSSRYDIYQDVYPADAPKWLHREGWPEDLVWLPNGDWMHGWADIQKKPDGTPVTYQGGVINSERGLARAKTKIPADLKTTPYLCRFIDTTTASPWREDYNPAHPLTRSEDRHYKMALLQFCAEDMKLVVGTETGIDPSVPYADYYEGMMSLAPYRLPDAGYQMMAYKTPTPDFLKYQVGHFYRIPLWELVYHECVVAGWYWGDSTNKDPEVWPQRDLFNLLYGTPPLFMFDRDIWDKNKAHFVQTYQTVCPVVRRLGYDEMRSHEFLTPDHAVQRTRWSSGAEVVVNFGETAYPLPDGRTVAPGGFLVR